MLTLVLNVTGRTDARNLRFDPEQRRVLYDGTGMLGVAQFYQELVGRIDALPGVASAGAASAAPLNQGLFPVTLNPFPVVGSTAAVTDQLAYGNQVSPEFFATLGIRPLAGRLLEPTDRRGGAGVAVVNETYARTYLDGQNPIGRRISAGFPAMRPGGIGGIGSGGLGEQTIDEAEVVGVIPDIKQANLLTRAAGRLPPTRTNDHAQDGDHGHAALDSSTLIPAIRRELASWIPLPRRAIS
jgi:hypothetical protein